MELNEFKKTWADMVAARDLIAKVTAKDLGVEMAAKESSVVSYFVSDFDRLANTVNDLLDLFERHGIKTIGKPAEKPDEKKEEIDYDLLAESVSKKLDYAKIVRHLHDDLSYDSLATDLVDHLNYSLLADELSVNRIAEEIANKDSVIDAGSEKVMDDIDLSSLAERLNKRDLAEEVVRCSDTRFAESIAEAIDPEQISRKLSPDDMAAALARIIASAVK